uniref:Peptidase C1A papain C-terminal domain-containing protein n=1 Tax=Oryza rufipogon TaxID=4529 RepID=A0A0E0QPG0_ORYRU
MAAGKLVLLLVALMATTTSRAAAAAASMEGRHEEWMAENGRTYEDAAEKARRFRGSTPAATGRTASLGVNEFTDLTDEEFVARYTAAGYYSNATSFKFGVAAHKLPGFMYENVSLSSEGGYTLGIDWRERGAVTNFNCIIYWWTNMNHVPMCANACRMLLGVLRGCSHGGHQPDHDQRAGEPLRAAAAGLLQQGCRLQWRLLHGSLFAYIGDGGGITTESAYPYQRAQGPCRFSAGEEGVATIRGYQEVPLNEAALAQAVAHQPVSVAITAGGFRFKQYQNGVFMADHCDDDLHLNHEVTVVGYGVDDSWPTTATTTSTSTTKSRWWGTAWTMATTG